MDILTHALVGGSLAAALAPRPHTRPAVLVAMPASLLPDVDALARSAADPLLELELHRHFTHALAFVPVGALVAALLLWPLFRRRLPFLRIYLYALCGYGMAGLLDACTSYGTHLLWPMREEPVAWNVISIFDPLFTLLLALPLGLATRRCAAWPARAGLALAVGYLLLGALQHQRAERAALALAASRGHVVERLIVKPTMANLLLWRSVYQSGGRFYADAQRMGLTSRSYAGESVALLDRASQLPWVSDGSRAANDIVRFTRFSSGWVALHPGRADFVGDMRYAMLPTRIEPLWGIALDRSDVAAPARFLTLRRLDAETRSRFLAMVLGHD